MLQAEARDQLLHQRHVEMLVAVGDRHEVDVVGDVAADREQQPALVAAGQREGDGAGGAQRVDRAARRRGDRAARANGIVGHRHVAARPVPVLLPGVEVEVVVALYPLNAVVRGQPGRKPPVARHLQEVVQLGVEPAPIVRGAHQQRRGGGDPPGLLVVDRRHAAAGIEIDPPATAMVEHEEEAAAERVNLRLDEPVDILPERARKLQPAARHLAARQVHRMPEQGAHARTARVGDLERRKAFVEGDLQAVEPKHLTARVVEPRHPLAPDHELPATVRRPDEPGHLHAAALSIGGRSIRPPLHAIAGDRASAPPAHKLTSPASSRDSAHSAASRTTGSGSAISPAATDRNRGSRALPTA